MSWDLGTDDSQGGVAPGVGAPGAAASAGVGPESGRLAVRACASAHDELVALIAARAVPTANGDAEAALIQLEYACRRVGDAAERAAELAARLAVHDVDVRLAGVPARVGNALVVDSLRVQDVLDALSSAPRHADRDGLVVTLGVRVEELHRTLDDVRRTLDLAEREVTDLEAPGAARHLRPRERRRGTRHRRRG